MAVDRRDVGVLRLADHVAFHHVVATFPPDLVDRVIERTGRVEQRRRLLSARTTTYYLLAMALFADTASEDVLHRVLRAQEWASGWPRRQHVPNKAAISKARGRLGVAPLAELLAEACAGARRRASGSQAVGSHRLVELVSAAFDLPASRANRLGFPSAPRPAPAGEVPSLTMTGLVDVATGALLAAAFASLPGAASDPLALVLERLEPGMLCRGVVARDDVAARKLVVAAGAHLLWATSGPLPLRVRHPLPDGTFTAELVEGRTGAHTDGVLLRVVELAGVQRSGGGHPDRLLTTLLDSDAVSRDGLLRLFRDGPRSELALPELRATATEPLRLRSRSPQGVAQEAHAALCVHHALVAVLSRQRERPTRSES